MQEAERYGLQLSCAGQPMLEACYSLHAVVWHDILAGATVFVESGSALMGLGCIKPGFLSRTGLAAMVLLVLLVLPDFRQLGLGWAS